MKAVVVLSGGIDSAVALTMARAERDVHCVTFDYGQVSLREELKASATIAKYFEVPWTPIFLPASIFSGALISGQIPSGLLRDLQPKGTSPVEIPFRNAIFLSCAVAFAIQHDATEVWHGIHAEDGTEWAYPDNSPEFLGSMAAATWIGSAHRVRLVSPFEYATKTSVINTGIEIGAPLGLTYTCYRGGEVACGDCISCEARIEAFRKVNAIDPIDYMKEVKFGETTTTRQRTKVQVDEAWRPRSQVQG